MTYLLRNIICWKYYQTTMASSSMTTSSTPSPVVKQEPSVENYFPLNLGNQRPASQMGSHPMHQQGRPMSRSPAMTPTPAAMTPLPPSRTPAPHTPSPLDPLRTPGLSPAQTPPNCPCVCFSSALHSIVHICFSRHVSFIWETGTVIKLCSRLPHTHCRAKILLVKN